MGRASSGTQNSQLAICLADQERRVGQSVQARPQQRLQQSSSRLGIAHRLILLGNYQFAPRDQIPQVCSSAAWSRLPSR